MKNWFLLSLMLISVVCVSQAQLQSNTISKNWIGAVRLDRSEVNATIHNTFIEIEEEAELTPVGLSVSDAPDASQHYNLEIAGTFTLPKNSVLTGAILWNGDNIIKAQLKGDFDSEKQYEKIIKGNGRGQADLNGDETTPLMLSLVARGDAYDSVDTYVISLGQAHWKNQKRIRLRYIVPMRYQSSIPQMNLPRVFASVCKEIPTNYTLNLTGDATTTEVKLLRNGKIITRKLPNTIIDNFADGPAYSVQKSGVDAQGIITKTQFPDGADTTLYGEFMHLWTQIPDSLFLAAGLKREVVFLWRWENENSLVLWEDTTQDKFLSVYGKKAIRQAADIHDAAIRLMSTKAGVGMYLDRTEKKADTVFQMAYKNSPESEKLLGYLQYLMEDDGANIFASIAGHKIDNEHDGDTLSADELDSICEEGKADFEIAIDTVLNLFSKDQNLIKHVVVVSAGKRKTDKNKLKLTKLKEGFEEITFSGYGIDNLFPSGYWPGVDLDQIIEDNKLINGENYNGFNLPRSKAATFSVTLKSSDNSFTQDLLGEKDKDKKVFYDNVYFSGHAAKEWNDTLIWEAQDSTGTILSTFTQVPLVEKNQMDTSIAMLWGGSHSSPYSEVFKSKSAGYLIGFIDNDYALLGHSGDSLSQDIKDAIENGGEIPNIKSDEKHKKSAPIIHKLDPMKTVGLHSIHTIAGNTLFSLFTGDIQKSSLAIYDLKGRLIMFYTHDMLIGKSNILWDGNSIHGAPVSNGMYVAVATFDKRTQVMKFVR